ALSRIYGEKLTETLTEKSKLHKDEWALELKSLTGKKVDVVDPQEELYADERSPKYNTSEERRERLTEIQETARELLQLSGGGYRVDFMNEGSDLHKLVLDIRTAIQNKEYENVSNASNVAPATSPAS